MEESSAMCIDPEEDEIFFYGIIEKEAELNCTLKKCKQSEGGILSGQCSEESNQISETAGLKSGSGNSGNDPETLITIEQMPDMKLSVNCSSTSAAIVEKEFKIYENNPGKPTGLRDGPDSREKVTHDENEKENLHLTALSPLEEQNGENKEKFHKNKVNIYADHNYTIPVKTVIDRTILNTPKSVVKADKDGGFLKVLSEIALVKAEVDENTPNDALMFTDLPSGKEVENDYDKENVEKTGNDLINLREATPLKSLQDLGMNKLNSKTENVNFLSSSEIPKDNISYTIDHDVKSHEEQKLKNENGDCVNTCDRNIVPDAEDMICEMEDACKKGSDELNEIQVIFQKLTTSVKKPVDDFKTEKPVNASGLEKLSFTDKLSGEGHELDERHGENEEIDSKMAIKKVPIINILDESLTVQKDQEKECIFRGNGMSIEDERHKKFLRRKTIKLLEELSEIVCHENMRKESNVGKETLSEEAAKVIQQLKSVGLDDSIQSPDQYFDLDNLNETFLSSEMSGILNDTLSKPLDLLTNKDLAILLEKISGTTLDEKFRSQTDIAEVFDPEKENVCQNKIGETFNGNFENFKSNKTHIKLVNSGNIEKTPANRKINSPSQQRRNLQKCTPYGKCFSDIKKVNERPLIQSQPNQNRFRGCRTVEKAAKPNLDTRIPKPTSTKSKLPIKGSGDWKIPSKTLTKTPHRKTPKNLKFDNIESPVQAYINAKTPVLISNVKGKSDPGFNVWPKQATNGAKMSKPQAEIKITKNEPTSNLPYVKYRSAIPLKLDKAPESRLPRLAPKMHKLILGNSPVIAKHEGRIPLAMPSRPEISLNDSSVMMKPNEVSVIVRKVALNSNVDK